MSSESLVSRVVLCGEEELEASELLFELELFERGCGSSAMVLGLLWSSSVFPVTSTSVSPSDSDSPES